MLLDSEFDELFEGQDFAEREIRLLFADRDPISRHVLGSLLRKNRLFEVVGCVDSPRLLSDWQAEDVDVIILAVGPQDDVQSVVRELTARRLCVLVLGTVWTWDRLDAAFRAGALGCLVKDTAVADLAAAARAVTSGHTVLSPELHGIYTGTPAAGADGGDRSFPDTRLRSLTDREHEVLAMLARGVSTAEAAGLLRVSAATVKSHVSHAIAKLGVRNRLEAVLLMRQAMGRATRTAS